MFVTADRKFNFKKLFEVACVITKNLNKVIDVNYYPTEQARYSNTKNRPIGIGVQGLSDSFKMMFYDFDSPEAMKLNLDIFETIQFASYTTSKDLAKIHGPYQSYAGSPMSQGKMQHDLWGIKDDQLSGMWDWKGLREEIAKYGMRNSLLTALMPTASTAQILGNCESFEPATSNIYVRRTLAGEFVCVSKYLLQELIDLGIWNLDLKNRIVANNGSVMGIPEIPKDIQMRHRTVWEISQKNIVKMAADRGRFIDQSQSLNIHMQDVSKAKLTSLHFYAWELGLKTGMYYLRSQPSTDAIKFTIDVKMVKQQQEQAELFKMNRANGQTAQGKPNTNKIDMMLAPPNVKRSDSLGLQSSSGIDIKAVSNNTAKIMAQTTTTTEISTAEEEISPEERRRIRAELEANIRRIEEEELSARSGCSGGMCSA